MLHLLRTYFSQYFLCVILFMLGYTTFCDCLGGAKFLFYMCDTFATNLYLLFKVQPVISCVHLVMFLSYLMYIPVCFPFCLCVVCDFGRQFRLSPNLIFICHLFVIYIMFMYILCCTCFVYNSHNTSLSHFSFTPLLIKLRHYLNLRFFVNAFYLWNTIYLFVSMTMLLLSVDMVW